MYIKKQQVLETFFLVNRSFKGDVMPEDTPFFFTWIFWGGNIFPDIGDGSIPQSLQDKHMLIAVHHLKPSHDVQVSALLLLPKPNTTEIRPSLCFISF